ncbi:MAG: MBL fold metallo-hydrolase RNA specificity domain-containing protein [bacterium]
MQTRLRFLGAARNVTGSCFYMEANGTRFIVDCGLYQERDLRYRNWEPFSFPPEGLDAVCLTHAHLDHCGLLPKLVREGFHGRIVCTAATADIARIVLMDSAKIQEEDAAAKKKRHQREGREGAHPEIPLYTVEDAESVFPFLTPVAYGVPVPLNDAVSITFHDAGHILGSSMITVRLNGNGTESTVLFSGDVGRRNSPILRDPATFHHADYVLVESTYGDRLHQGLETIPRELARIVNETHRAGGNVVIPSFAVERTQELLYRLSGLLAEDRIPHLPVFVDSPMAVRVTEVFGRHRELFDEETRALLEKGRHPCDFPGLIMVRSVDESKMINHIRGTAIIIAGSGMCTGGRIKHHLINNISRPESTIMFVGYQAKGTLGREILDGAESVRILGEERPVKARVERINGFSAHADREELFQWLAALKRPPRHLFVIHGEENAAEAFAAGVRERTGWGITVAAYNQEVSLA